MATNADKVRQLIDDEKESIIDDITLSESDRQFILNNPTIFSDIWSGTIEATLLKHWPLILGAQVIKAKGGDTAAAKFITEFVETLGNKQSLEANGSSSEWEDKAIEIRDKVGIEISAESLVTLLLDKLSKWPAAKIRGLLAIP